MDKDSARPLGSRAVPRRSWSTLVVVKRLALASRLEVLASLSSLPKRDSGIAPGPRAQRIYFTLEIRACRAARACAACPFKRNPKTEVCLQKCIEVKAPYHQKSTRNRAIKKRTAWRKVALPLLAARGAYLKGMLGRGIFWRRPLGSYSYSGPSSTSCMPSLLLSSSPF